MTYKVLFVDDDERILSSFRRGLRKKVDLHTANGGAEGLKALDEEGPFSIVVSDQKMPEIDGATFLSQVKTKDPNAVRIMLTGNSDQQTAMNAVNEGEIFRFLTKPCEPSVLVRALLDAGKQHDLMSAEKQLLENTLSGSVKVLVDLLAISHPDAFKQTNRLRKWGKILRPHIEGLNAWELDMSILLSRIGDVLLPADVSVKLRNNEKLNDTEQTLVDHMPEAARDLIMNIPRLEDVASAVYLQNKGYDGSGFPKTGLAGEGIPLMARTLRILNDLIANQVQSSSSGQDAFEHLKSKVHLYDPVLLEKIESLLKEEIESDLDSEQTVTVVQLQEGDTLLSDIHSTEGKLLLASGTELNEAIIRKICQIHTLVKVNEPISVKR